MKRGFVLFFPILCFGVLKAQSIKPPPPLIFTCVSWRVVVKDDKGLFETNSDWAVNNVRISLDLNTKKMVVYSEHELTFDFMVEAGIYKNDFGSWAKWETALDNEGKRATIRLLNYGSMQKGGYSHTLYIDYSDKTIQMNIYSN